MRIRAPSFQRRRRRSVPDLVVAAAPASLSQRLHGMGGLVRGRRPGPARVRVVRRAGRVAVFFWVCVAMYHILLPHLLYFTLLYKGP